MSASQGSDTPHPEGTIVWPEQADRPDSISDEAFAAFEVLFERWRRSGWNQDALEDGGVGDLRALAREAYLWALEERQR